ncbi:MAG: RNA polymerase factor sigma-54, partial [Burkholderiaceae bacterium]
MKPSLQLRQSQQLTLTPQLQQSIKLLQMSTLELSQEIDQALADNPMLERSDDPLGEAMRIAPNGSLQAGDGAGPEANNDTPGRDVAADTSAPEAASERQVSDDGLS